MMALHDLAWYDITTVVHDGDDGVAHGVCDGMMAWYDMAWHDDDDDDDDKFSSWRRRKQLFLAEATPVASDARHNAS